MCSIALALVQSMALAGTPAHTGAGGTATSGAELIMLRHGVPVCVESLYTSTARVDFELGEDAVASARSLVASMNAADPEAQHAVETGGACLWVRVVSVKQEGTWVPYASPLDVPLVPPPDATADRFTMWLRTSLTAATGRTWVQNSGRMLEAEPEPGSMKHILDENLCEDCYWTSTDDPVSESLFGVVLSLSQSRRGIERRAGRDSLAATGEWPGDGPAPLDRRAEARAGVDALDAMRTRVLERAARTHPGVASAAEAREALLDAMDGRDRAVLLRYAPLVTPEMWCELNASDLTEISK
ncbi:MAG: hypothetical protein R3F61_02195 [Myxococcota bacterium]